MTPVEAGNDVFGPRLERFCQGLTRSKRNTFTRARGAVGVAGVDQNSGDFAFGDFEIFLGELNRGGLHHVAREYRRGMRGLSGTIKATSSFLTLRMPA